jgi:hypothetical protein
MYGRLSLAPRGLCWNEEREAHRMYGGLSLAPRDVMC